MDSHVKNAFHSQYTYLPILIVVCSYALYTTSSTNHHPFHAIHGPTTFSHPPRCTALSISLSAHVSPCPCPWLGCSWCLCSITAHAKEVTAASSTIHYYYRHYSGCTSVLSTSPTLLYSTTHSHHLPMHTQGGIETHSLLLIMIVIIRPINYLIRRVRLIPLPVT